MAKNDAIMDCSTIVLKTGDKRVDECVKNINAALDNLTTHEQTSTLAIAVAAQLLIYDEDRDYLITIFSETVRMFIDKYLSLQKEID